MVFQDAERRVLDPGSVEQSPTLTNEGAAADAPRPASQPSPGAPWRARLREALLRITDMRDRFGLHDRIRIIASGKLVNPSDVAWALCAGADFVTSARGFMFSLGCIQALKCNKNTCPTGITTHQKHLQRGLVVEQKFEKVANYAKQVIHEVETIAHSVGVNEPRRMRRSHVRVVQANGDSVLLSKLRPNVDAGDVTKAHV